MKVRSEEQVFCVVSHEKKSVVCVLECLALMWMLAVLPGQRPAINLHLSSACGAAPSFTEAPAASQARWQPPDKTPRMPQGLVSRG